MKEKRRHNRINIRLLADIISVNKKYIGAIENLSEKGVYIRLFPQSNILNFIPKTPLRVEFKCLSGEELNLNCVVRWVYAYEKQEHGLTTILGTEIIKPPQKYKELIRNL
jgi:hypothetical protein